MQSAQNSVFLSSLIVGISESHSAPTVHLLSW